MPRITHQSAIAGPDAIPEIVGKSRVTEAAIQQFTKDVPGDRKAMTQNLLRKYLNWTWRDALDAHAKEKSAATAKPESLTPPVSDRAAPTNEPSGQADAKPVDKPKGGRYGFAGRDEEIYTETHPTSEVFEMRKQAEKLYPGDVEGQLAWLRSPLQMRDLRMKLLARKGTSVPVVSGALTKFGIPQATPEKVGDVFKYLFDSQGIAFDYENYAAWERLAAGKGTISDARFLVHEFAEIGDMKARNVDPNGPENFGGNGVARDAWRESFNKEYLVSHGKALYAESQFVASQIETIAKVSLTPEVTASVDPVREPDELGYMTMPDGSRLVANRDFPAWKARASEQVSIDSAAAKRLGVNSTKLTLADLVRAVKSAKMTP